jgi:hypothetical protein
MKVLGKVQGRVERVVEFGKKGSCLLAKYNTGEGGASY